nr:permease [Rothia mucilaginosa]
MGMILPLLYLGVGFGLAMLLPEHWSNRLKESASALLTRWIIPTVIIYTVATSRPELFFVAASTMVLMLLGVLGAGRITGDPVQKLAFVYLNAGLFGIPVVAGFWGEEAVRVYIGAYIGNSVMGNILGTSLMRRETNTDGLTTSRAKPTRQAVTHKAAVGAVLRSLLTNRPIIAVAIGLICLPAGPFLNTHAAGIYRLITWVFSFVGLMVLGMWLSTARLHRTDLKQALRWAVLRVVLVSVYSVGILTAAHWMHTHTGVHLDQLLAHP